LFGFNTEGGLGDPFIGSIINYHIDLEAGLVFRGNYIEKAG
jgi:hypothetical protein